MKVHFTTCPIEGKEQEQQLVCMVERGQQGFIRHNKQAYLPLLCKISPLVRAKSYPTDSELTNWDYIVKRGQFYARSADIDKFTRGQSDTVKIIRAVVEHEYDYSTNRDFPTVIVVDDCGECGKLER